MGGGVNGWMGAGLWVSDGGVDDAAGEGIGCVLEAACPSICFMDDGADDDDGGGRDCSAGCDGNGIAGDGDGGGR